MEAFLSAVVYFNCIDGLRYLWPRFLQERGRRAVPFWEDLRNDILLRLNNEPVLESRYSKQFLFNPTALSYIDPQFRLGGEPLVETEATKKSHLSFLYDSDSSQLSSELKAIGVKSMTHGDFFREFEYCIEEKGVDFLKSRSASWHSKIARICRVQLYNDSW